MPKRDITSESNDLFKKVDYPSQIFTGEFNPDSINAEQYALFLAQFSMYPSFSSVPAGVQEVARVCIKKYLLTKLRQGFTVDITNNSDATIAQLTFDFAETLFGGQVSTYNFVNLAINLFEEMSQKLNEDISDRFKEFQHRSISSDDSMDEAVAESSMDKESTKDDIFNPQASTREAPPLPSIIG